MSLKDVTENLKNFSHYAFNDNELMTFRQNISELYKVLKRVFDTPRRLPRCYNSLTAYKLSRERRYSSPSDFYHFSDDNVYITICYRTRRRCFSVGVIGWSVPNRFINSNLSNSEHEFSQGFLYYGDYSRKDFDSCIKLWRDIVSDYIKNKFLNEELF